MEKRYISAARTDAVTEREAENREVSYRAALEGIVLLKNDGALPVKPGKIALYGAGATRTVKGGTGSGEVNERSVISIKEGLELAGYEIVSRRWLDDYEKEYESKYSDWLHMRGVKESLIDNMANPFQPPAGRFVIETDADEADCDTAIYVVARQAGEGSDKKLERGEFNLTGLERSSIERIAKSFKNSVLVINSGSYMDIGDLDEKVSAVIYYCQQGMEGGHAFADILSGAVSPSGKLTDSWARCYEDVPNGENYSYLSGDTSKEFYNEGIFVGYRYFDTFNVAPRYPFGFGLSYTEFETVFRGIEYRSGEFAAALTVKNTGSVSGREVAQVYAYLPEGTLVKEKKRLVGFAKTKTLNPGEEQTLNISFTPDYLASYCESRAEKLLEAGKYIIAAGNSSASAIPAAVIELDETVAVYKLKNICTPQKSIKEIMPPEGKNATVPSEGLQTLSLKAEDIKTVKADYYTLKPAFDAKVEKMLDEMSVRDMTEMCVGAGLGGMTETDGIYAPGTVGRTTMRFASKGVPNVNLSDGPAGLRLLKCSALTKNGKQKFKDGNFMMSSMVRLPKAIQKLLSAKDGDEVLYQFTTSFPVGTALAQSWNTELMEEVGRAISREMTEYGITYWLAPAMNIHRNPLCGRNFEYLSEDPVLTGKIAAGLCRGVESISGNYAVIKHFACNNVEDNRTHSDSILTERTLREIYLRGFEIAVREAQPGGVMTSYNLLNGTYTPDSRDLCTAVLRNEWGFTGLVMTDWFSTAPGQGNAAGAIVAGNDLMMPGQGTDKLSILIGVMRGDVSRSELRICAGRVLQAVLNAKALEITDR